MLVPKHRKLRRRKHSYLDGAGVPYDVTFINFELLTVFGCVEKNPGEDGASYTRDKAPIWNHLADKEKKKLTEFVEGSNQNEVLLCVSSFIVQCAYYHIIRAG